MLGFTGRLLDHPSLCSSYAPEDEYQRGHYKRRRDQLEYFESNCLSVFSGEQNISCFSNEENMLRIFRFCNF